ARGVGEAMAVVMDLFITQANWAFVLPDRIPIPKSRRLRQSIQHLNDVVYKLIRDRRKVSAGDDPTAGSDLLTNLLAVKDEGGGRMTDEQLRDEIMTLFLAGHDTPANTLSWTWYLLAQNPKADATLGAELHEVLGNRAPAPADLPRLPYTEMVMKESMRLYPPAWGVGRRAIHDFDLERWRHDPIRNGKIPRFSYFPFGGGPRVCVGAGFAMMEATLLLATIAQKFRLTLAPHQSIQPLFSVTLRPKNGIRMHLHPR